MVAHYRYNPTMPVKRVQLPEAQRLLAEGYKYVDVRSVPEFESGHPQGALNIPLMHFLPGRGMSPNGDFATVFEQRFAKDEKIVLGCKSGGRSLRAADMLQGMGYTNVIDAEPGYEGWKNAGLPIETAAPGRTWADLSAK
jgi:rhodanese-related sulfurtransferase